MSEVITIGEPIVTFASTEPDVSLVDALNKEVINQQFIDDGYKPHSWGAVL